MKSAGFLCFLTFCLLILTNCQGKKIEAQRLEKKPETEIKSDPVQLTKTETSEEKAIRLAEEFIKRNGYTEAPADKDNLSNETIEFYDNIDEQLKGRHNTLEPKAYGIVYRGGLGDDKAWTVVFRYSEKITKEVEKSTKSNLVSNPKITGRAVTMNEKFENLLVEHKDFFLDKVDKKF